VTVVDLVVLSHYMLIAPGNRTEVGLVVLYSLSAGVAAALIVGHSTTHGLRRVAGVAARLGENDLDARVGELRASPELRQVGAARHGGGGGGRAHVRPPTPRRRRRRLRLSPRLPAPRAPPPAPPPGSPAPPPCRGKSRRRPLRRRGKALLLEQRIGQLAYPQH